MAVFHLGVDYGTCWSKLALRDREARGGDVCYVLEDDGGDFRFPPTVTFDAGRLWFGREAETRSTNPDARVYRSVKARAFVDATIGDHPALPDGLALQDLAGLTVAYLCQIGIRSANRVAQARTTTARLGMTLGAPLSSLATDPNWERAVEVARVGLALAREPTLGSLRDGIALPIALELLAKARVGVVRTAVSNRRAWVRSEAEAALLWPFRCQEVPAGTFACVDVGAGTTSASFFAMVLGSGAEHQQKVRLAFYGTACRTPGMDAVGDELQRTFEYEHYASVRGQEDGLLARRAAQQNPRLNQLRDQLRRSLKDAWFQTYGKQPREGA